jgi:transcriptional regulator with XRE-family HTH domain
MDIGLRLRELRLWRGMSQRQVSRLTGLGVKTISSFETGERIGSMKVAQLERLLRAYQISELEFFAQGDTELQRMLRKLSAFPQPVQREIVSTIDTMVNAAQSFHAMVPAALPRMPEMDWHLLNSEN